MNKNEQLTQSALQLFWEKGFHQTRIEDIVKHAKTGKGTFYLYYKDKEEVYLKALHALFLELKNTLTWVDLEIKEEVNVDQIFLQEAHKITKTLTDNKLCALIYFREGRSIGPLVAKMIENFGKDLLGHASQTYQHLIDLNILPPINSSILAICVMGAIEKVYEQWLFGHIDLSEEQVIKNVYLFLSRALDLSEI